MCTSNYNNKYKCAFTLAEVLITLAIIGVVAALTIPTLMTNIQNRVKISRVQNIKHKFSRSTDVMMSLTTLNGYSSTMAFVEELQNHLGIAKICDNNHIRDCWSSDEVIIDTNGKTWDISKTKTAETLQMKDDEYHQYDDTVGIITKDGTPMILSYDLKCNIDKYQTITWNNDQSSTVGCIAAVFDWNNQKEPNELGKDVILFNANGLGTDCAIKINDKCYTAPRIITPLSNAECLERQSELGLEYCNSGDDYYAGAVAMCGGKDNLPTQDDLMTLAQELYPGKNIYPGYTSFSTPYSNEYILNKMSELGFLNNGTESDPFFILFSNNEKSETYSYYRYYTPTGTKYTDCCRARNANDKQVICTSK